MNSKAELPEAFTEQIKREHPEYAERVLEGIGSEARTSVRLNRSKLEILQGSGEYPDFEQNLPIMEFFDKNVPWESDAFYLKKRPSFTLDPFFHAGMYYVQESSSMAVGAVIRKLFPYLTNSSQSGNDESGDGSFAKKEDLPPIRVLDLCAAPGGKSTHIASILRDRDLLVCNEVHRGRAQILRENMIKWGTSNVVVTGNDPAHFRALGSWFDVILVDAPCSGEGLFRRDPSAVKEWSPEAVENCSLRQTQILADIWPVLKPGGILIYSTCTFNLAENDKQVIELLSNTDADSERIHLHEYVVESSVEFVQRKNKGLPASNKKAWIYRFFPGLVDGEGFTFSVIRKNQRAEMHYPEARNKGRISLSKKDAPVRKYLGLISGSESFEVLSEKNGSYAVHKSHVKDVLQIDDSLHVHYAGIGLGDEKRPDHALTQSLQFKRNMIPEIDVSRESAIAYLKRESIAVNPDLNGLHVITFNGVPLGFGKATRGRINNHYPQEWRIRMHT